MPAQMYFVLVLLPLFASMVGGLGHRIIGEKAAMAVTTGSVLISAMLALFGLVNIAVLGHEPVDATLYSWISTGDFSVNFGVYVDKLTSLMLVLVTVVSAMVHIYSIGYMHEDPSKPRFFSYLSLFTFMMLALVTAPNLLQLFLGWEGVGLASYLLIGFWHHKESANAASLKAFVVNRVADMGLIVAMLIGFAAFGSIAFGDMFASANAVAGQSIDFLGMNVPVLEIFGLLLLFGAMGKSAQIGLHTWLPDAMEGPTPVSALIHAATMVTAGVFLLARMSPVLELTEVALTTIAWVGALTAIFAATIGLTQRDIKRVIAYSTCSQLGYMFFACGVSAYSAAMFHLFTHGFFKALLFLAAGSVIHGLHHEQDLFKMGGVKRLLPITYGLMWIGSLALAGIPPFAGFFSKDFILESAVMSGTETGYALYIIGTLAALLTAFYSFRVVFLAFHGKFEGPKEVYDHAHESPLVMTGPMLVLAVGAIITGFLGLSMTYTEWWDGAIVILEEIHPGVHEAHHTPWYLKYLPLVVAVAGIVAAWFVYVKKRGMAERIAKGFDSLYAISFNKWYFDELYDFIVVRQVKRLGRFFWQKGDVGTIDRFGPDGAAWVTRKFSAAIRPLQTGYIYHYAFVLILGMLALMTWLMI